MFIEQGNTESSNSHSSTNYNVESFNLFKKLFPLIKPQLIQFNVSYVLIVDPNHLWLSSTDQSGDRLCLC